MDAGGEVLEESLSEIVAALEVDGYSMRIEDWASGRLTLNIEAGQDACEDCLVPPKTMELIVRGVLPDSIDVREVAIRYPAGSVHGHY